MNQNQKLKGKTALNILKVMAYFQEKQESIHFYTKSNVPWKKVWILIFTYFKIGAILQLEQEEVINLYMVT